MSHYLVKANVMYFLRIAMQRVVKGHEESPEKMLSAETCLHMYQPTHEVFSIDLISFSNILKLLLRRGQDLNSKCTNCMSHWLE